MTFFEEISLRMMATKMATIVPKKMNARLYRMVFLSSSVNWPDMNRNLKFCRPMKGLFQMPLLYWKFVNAMYAPGIGMYENTKKKMIAGTHMRIRVLF